MSDDGTAVPVAPLGATYRLQFHAGFTLADARAIVPYLERLGVSHAYASPLLAARTGSTHGYDVTDPSRLNPALGDDDERRALGAELRRRGMGLLLDIVPNHMAASPENPYWRDVLMHGRASRWARWFDIDWYAPDEELRGRVLLPVLGARVAEVLAKGEIRLAWSDAAGLEVQYWENRFPLDPQTIPWVLGLDLPDRPEGGLGELAALLGRLRRLPARSARDAREAPAVERRARESAALVDELRALVARDEGVRAQVERAAAEFGRGEAAPARLRRLLDRQAYSLVFWRRAAQEINYRRFFNINELVALRMEAPGVLEETHATILDWVADGTVDGLRIDHVDGLRDPLDYLRRLRVLADARRPAAPGGVHVPILVEKILAGGERLRTEWPVDGTTGYETLNDLEVVLADAEGVARIERQYAALLELDRRGATFHEVALAGKRKVLRNSLAADVGRLAKLLAPIAARDPRTQALDREALVDAIVETIAAMAVYRTYVDTAPRPAPGGRRAATEDAQEVDRAIAQARERGEADAAALDLLREVLLLEGVDDRADDDARDRRRFTSRFQQISGPAAAKGVEDTALYLYVPFLPLNEVGGEPDRDLHAALDDFHAGNAMRASEWPRALVTTSTHDTKRGADTRARLEVLAEMPDAWWAHVTRWRKLNGAHRRRVGRRWAPDANTEYLLYQTLVGIWPVIDGAGAGDLPDAAVLEVVRARAAQYMEKAVREGKSRSSWVSPDAEFERALADFIAAVLDPGRAGSFVADLHALARRLAPAGYWNGLARTALHLTVPGVPDVYQGTELWDFSLVDPDNRREVDFALRSALLDDLVSRYDSESPADRDRLLTELVVSPGDGRVKLWVVHRLLRARRERARLFAEGGYTPLAGEGARARHLVAFARSTASVDDAAVVLAARLPWALAGEKTPTGEGVWGDTRVSLPPALAGRRWRCALTGAIVPVRDGVLRVHDALTHLPTAVLLVEPVGG